MLGLLALEGFHDDGLSGRVFGACRADVHAGTAAGAVVSGNGDAELVAGHAAKVDELHGSRSGLSLSLGQSDRTDDGVRADIGTLVTLDTFVGLPLRNEEGNAAFLQSGGAEGLFAFDIVGEDRDGDVVAVLVVGRDEDVVHELLEFGVFDFEERGLRSVRRVGPCSRDFDFRHGGEALVDGFVVHADDVFALSGEGLGGSVFHELECFLTGDDLSQVEERGLQDGGNTVAKADFLCDGGSVDGIELDVVLGDVLLDFRRDVLVELFLGLPEAVEQEGAAVFQILDHVVALDVGLVVAGDKVSGVDEVGGVDGLIAETKVGDGDTAGFLRVVCEVSLDLLVGVVTDDLDGVLVGADGTVRAETPELTGIGSLRNGVENGGDGQAQVADIVVDGDGEVLLRLCSFHVLIDRDDVGRSGVFTTETEAAAVDGNAVELSALQGSDDVEVKGLAVGAGLLGSVEDRDLLDGLRKSGNKILLRERSVKVALDETDFGAVRVQVVDRLLDGAVDGTHGDDDVLGVLSTIVVEQVIVRADLLVDGLHVLLGDFDDVVISRVAGFACLEEDLGGLSGTSLVGMLRVQSLATEVGNGVPVDHLGEGVVVPDFDLLDLVGSTETVEEVHEGDFALDGGKVSDGAEVHAFLNGVRAKHGKTGLAAGHDVGVVTEDVQGVARDAAGGNVHDAGSLLTGDLVHVRDHQEKTLRSRVGGGQSTGSDGTVNGTGGTGFGLHLSDADRLAEDVLRTGSSHRVGDFSHGGRRRDGVNGSNFRKCVRYGSGGSITIHGFEFSAHNMPPSYKVNILFSA